MLPDSAALHFSSPLSHPVRKNMMINTPCWGLLGKCTSGGEVRICVKYNNINQKNVIAHLFGAVGGQKCGFWDNAISRKGCGGVLRQWGVVGMVS